MIEKEIILDDFLGESVVCQVWSFTDRTDIPYRITRKGKPANEGGTGYKWRCTCPSSQNRNPVCKHIRTMRELAQKGIINNDDRYRLSDFGRQILNVSKLAERPVTPIYPEAQAIFAKMMAKFHNKS